jgi:protocatechuate 3,4-dioxygenase beta subunit
LLNDPSWGYFVIIVKKKQGNQYSFTSHQPSTSKNRTSKPDLEHYHPIPKPLELIPLELITQLNFEDAVTVRPIAFT